MKIFSKSKDNNEVYSDEYLVVLIKKAIKLTKNSRTEAQLCQVLENITIKNYKWIDPILRAIGIENNKKFNILLNEIIEFNKIRDA